MKLALTTLALLAGHSDACTQEQLMIIPSNVLANVHGIFHGNLGFDAIAGFFAPEVECNALTAGEDDPAGGQKKLVRYKKTDLIKILDLAPKVCSEFFPGTFAPLPLVNEKDGTARFIFNAYLNMDGEHVCDQCHKIPDCWVNENIEWTLTVDKNCAITKWESLWGGAGQEKIKECSQKMDKAYQALEAKGEL